MSNLSTQDPASLKMLFTEEIYLVPNEPAALGEITSAPLLGHEPKLEQEKPQAVLLSPEPETPGAIASFEYLGDNNKYFLVLHDDKVHTRMNPAHQEMLLKVMAAKKLELRDLAIVNISRYHGVKFEALKTFFSCTRVLLFGIDSTGLGLSKLALNKEQAAGGVKILATYALEEMRNSPDKKREFWNVMKGF